MVNKRVSKWDDKRPLIEAMAGTMKTAEIAKRIGVKESSLVVYCSREGVSLRVKNKQAEKAQQIAELVGDLFDQDFSLYGNPVDEAIKFLKKKIEM